MLKNIDYSFVENEVFFKDILHCEKEEACALAMKIYIKMSWDIPDHKFLFEVCFDQKLEQREFEPDRQKIISLLENLFKIIFSTEKNLFSRCIKHSFLNAIYSQMEYIDDAVFYCVLYNIFSAYEKVTTNVCYADFEERYVYSVNQPIFWNFTSILKLLSKNVFRKDRNWEITRIYEANWEIYKAVGLNTLNSLLGCVTDICEKYGYTDSDIYHNAISLLT